MYGYFRYSSAAQAREDVRLELALELQQSKRDELVRNDVRDWQVDYLAAGIEELAEDVPATRWSRSCRISAVTRCPICTKVASVVGVPTPTIACSSSQASAPSACWIVGSALSAAASGGVDAVIGQGMILVVVASGSVTPSLLEERIVCR